jgi:hypothetical protein
VATDWIQFPCSGTPEARWRYLDNGQIEVEGLGVPTGSWNHGIDKWHDNILYFGGKYGVPAYQLAGIIRGECPSGDAQGCCSPCNACPGMKNCGLCCAYGLMQLTLGTAQSVAKGLGLPIPSAGDLFDPAVSLELGTKYFSDLLKRYNGDFVSAAVGYNAGSVKCGGCSSGTFWNVCTDGSQYPLAAIKYANAALANGFPLGELPPISQPPIPAGKPISNFNVMVATALGAFGAFHATRKFLAPKRRRRSRSRAYA